MQEKDDALVDAFCLSGEKYEAERKIAALEEEKREAKREIVALRCRVLHAKVCN